MANYRMVLDDGWKDAVLTATSEETGLEIENTQDARRGYVWRSTDATAQTLTAIMPVTANGGGLIIEGSNITDDATVTVALKNGMTTLDTVALACQGDNFDGTRDWFVWFDEDPVDQLSIVITDTTNPDGYIQARRIKCGPYVTTEGNFQLGSGLIINEDTEHVKTKGQSLRSFGTHAKLREWSMNIRFMEEIERANLISKLTLHGMAEELWLSVYPERGGDLERHHSFICKRTTPIEMEHWSGTRWGQVLHFMET